MKISVMNEFLAINMIHPPCRCEESNCGTDAEDDAGFGEDAEKAGIGFWLVGSIGFGFCAGVDEGVVLRVKCEEDRGSINDGIYFEMYCESEEKTGL